MEGAGAGDWNRASDLRFTNFTNSNLRQPNPTKHHKRECSRSGYRWAELSYSGSSVAADNVEAQTSD
jgi:hypothetical protein